MNGTITKTANGIKRKRSCVVRLSYPDPVLATYVASLYYASAPVCVLSSSKRRHAKSSIRAAKKCGLLRPVAYYRASSAAPHA